ncbi:hypothetical protein A7975_20820 [Bacillus sp. FJAT-26390]|nr:hypothetical protein A7975_20820 [Bacillus sp. FJAT-26390]
MQLDANARVSIITCPGKYHKVKDGYQSRAVVVLNNGARKGQQYGLIFIREGFYCLVEVAEEHQINLLYPEVLKVSQQLNDLNNKRPTTKYALAYTPT